MGYYNNKHDISEATSKVDMSDMTSLFKEELYVSTKSCASKIPSV